MTFEGRRMLFHLSDKEAQICLDLLDKRHGAGARRLDHLAETLLVALQGANQGTWDP